MRLLCSAAPAKAEAEFGPALAQDLLLLLLFGRLLLLLPAHGRRPWGNGLEGEGSEGVE